MGSSPYRSQPPGGSGCPACGRPAPGNRSRCLYCGAELPSIVERGPPAQPPLSTRMPGSLRCPRCNGAALAYQERNGLGRALCLSCKGMYLDGLTFDYIVHRAAQEALGANSRVALSKQVARATLELETGYVRCPECSDHMSRANYGKCSGVLVDRCAPHGVWLDEGELQKILDFVATGGHALAQMIEDEARERARRERLAFDAMDRDIDAHELEWIVIGLA